MTTTRANELLDGGYRLQETHRMTDPGEALREMMTLSGRLQSPQYRRICRQTVINGFGPLGMRENLWAIEHTWEIMGRLLTTSTPYLWLNEMWEVAMVAAGEFPWQGRRWTPDLFPQHTMYWTYETNRAVEHSDDDLSPPPGTDLLSTFLMLLPDGSFNQSAICLEPTGRVAVPIPVKVGQLGQEVLHEDAGRTMGILEFLRSPYISMALIRASRADRRRWSREVKTQPPNIKVIMLRTVDSHGEALTHDPVDWSCRWFVRGHWRDQFFPSTKEHRPVWIAPYIKGPKDKPIRVPEPVVFRVVR